MRRVECTTLCPRGKYCSNKRISRRECINGLEKCENLTGGGLGVRTWEQVEEGQVSAS